MAKWQVLRMLEINAPHCVELCDRCFEAYRDFCKDRRLGWATGAKAFHEWSDSCWSKNIFPTTAK